MGRSLPFLSPFLKFLKNYVHSAEFRKYKKAIRKNPSDYILRAQFAKYCLQHCFTHHGGMETHRIEAVNQFENITRSDIFDPEIYYLMGRYCQQTDNRRAKEVYLEGIKQFNRYIEKNPDFRSEMETTLAIAMNLLTLQTSHVDPELEKFFKYIRRSYPLHVKRVELENEMEKTDSDQERIKQLIQEVKQLKASHDSERSRGKHKN